MKRVISDVVPAFMRMGAAAGFYESGSYEDGMAAYYRGDYETALKHFRPLAKQGNAGAQWVLGRMYYNGQGVLGNDAEAAKWYRKAAEQGNEWAQSFLGYMYEIRRDYAEAVKWYRKAADQGFIGAQFALGMMYAKGLGILPLDLVLAYMWLSLAAAHGDETSLRERRDEISEHMTPDEIAKAQRLARERKPK